MEPSVPDFEKRVHPIQRAEFADARAKAEADILAALACRACHETFHPTTVHPPTICPTCRSLRST